MAYNFKAIEKKWQKKWEEAKAFEVTSKSKKPKYYVLEMFPYPSGSGLHMGHAWNYTIGDILARFKIMQGFNVMHPMGFDALGLPAENAAIKVGEHPQEYTDKSIKHYIKQQKNLGLTYDWSRVVNTADPLYYKWDQWIFLKMFEKGLAYQKESAVNWCPKCDTVLANEQVVDGKCWRHEDTDVEIKHLKQWFLKITDYVDRLLEGHKKLNWPARTIAMQKNWIGKSRGVNVFWKVKDSEDILKTFTTTVDTMFGVTFVVISPEHPLLEKLITKEHKKNVEKYLEKIKNKTDLERTDLNKDKSGVFVGSYLINPINGEEVPLFVADYVLMNYGTGVVMGVPAHDQRDKDFSKKYSISEKQVLELDGKSFVYDDVDKYNVKGILINSEKFNGLSVKEGREAITKELEKKKMVERTIQYKLKDWGVARQRYWGTPIPIIHCENCSLKGKKVLSINFREQKVWDAIVEGIKTVESRALNPEEKSRYFGNYSIGDVLEFVNKNTNEKKYYEIISKDIFKSFDEFFKNKDLLTKCCSGKAPKTLNDLKKAYDYTKDYVDKIEKNGLVAWSIKPLDATIVPVLEKDLPVELPKKVTFGKGNPLLTNEKWLNVKCPVCGGKARREANTMDTFVNSSWYFLRYCDPHNDKKIFDEKKAKYWMPVDCYIGGAEHACMHLIYARFYTMFLHDLGLIDFDEFAPKLFHQGMLHAESGEKMSKSKGNIVLPETVSDKYGIDTARFFLSSLASPDKDIDWEEKGIQGSLRFVNRVIEYFDKNEFGKDSEEVEVLSNKTLKNVSDYFENFEYRKATIEIRALFDLIEKQKVSKETLGKFLQMFSPFCPHITEELWEKLGNKYFISLSAWPKVDESKLKVKKKEIDLNEKFVAQIKDVLEKVDVNSSKKVYLYVMPFELVNLDKKKISKEVGKNIEIFSTADKKKYDPKNMAKKARPGLAGVYVE